MNREEFIKHQEDMINELFPPEHRREVAEYAQDMLADACKEMERWHGKDWKEKAQADLDRTTAFLTELKALMERYNVVIDVDGDEAYLDLLIEIDGHTIAYPAYDIWADKQPQAALTPNNIFDYEKE